MKVDIQTPECDRMLEVREQSQAIGEFLDWLTTEGIHLSRWVHDEEYDRERLMTGTGRSTEQLLADFFKIDLTKVENEKRAILKALNPQGDL